jgi:hypothetical protein
MSQPPKHTRDMTDAEYRAERSRITGRPRAWTDIATDGPMPSRSIPPAAPARPVARPPAPASTSNPTPAPEPYRPSRVSVMDMSDEDYLALKTSVIGKI